MPKSDGRESGQQQGTAPDCTFCSTVATSALVVQERDEELLQVPICDQHKADYQKVRA